MTTAISFPPALDETTLQELDDLLAALRETHEEVPQWEFCDGLLTAVACTRRPIGVHEWLPMLLGDGEPLPAHAPLPQLPVFGTEAQQTRFLELAQARLDEILRQLDRPTHSLEEDDAFSPEVLDTRGAVLMMSAEEQAVAVDFTDTSPPKDERLLYQTEHADEAARAQVRAALAAAERPRTKPIMNVVPRSDGGCLSPR